MNAAPGNLASIVMARGPFDAASVEVDGHYGERGESARPATNDGRVQLPAYSVLSFTLRYEFPLFGHPAVARIDAQNVGNANGMMLDDSGTVLSERERGFMLTLAADF